MKKLLTLLFSIFLIFGFVKNAFAITDPLSVPNNIYGIHIFDENDLNDAARLVNTNGGDWGYVTVVINQTERDQGRWQKVFDKMRHLHLIPIIRIASIPSGDIWQKPSMNEINNWIAFLNSLNWVVKNRYVVIGNEPNHANEWGGTLSPEEYAAYLKTFSGKLKEASGDFFVLPAGLDASAPNSISTMEEALYLRRMLQAVPDVFANIDGWASHSYPNPAFTGSEFDSGKGTISTFSWELAYLKTLGITKNLPVFITETGWSNKINEQEIGKKLTYAFQNVWSDKRIVAVTPFILNYTSPPFDEFSWKKEGGSFYSFYSSVTGLAKVAGAPEQVIKGRILGIFINPFQIVGSSFSGAMLIQNLGQSIWNSEDISISDESNNIIVASSPFSGVEPQKLSLITFSSAAPAVPGNYKIPFVLQAKGKNISDSYPYEVVVVAQPEEKKVSTFVKLVQAVRTDIALAFFELRVLVSGIWPFANGMLK